MEELIRLWPIYLFAINGLIAWVLWSMRKSFATRDDIAAVKEQVGIVSGRVGVLERDISHLPTAASMHDTNIRLERMLGAMESVKGDYRHILDRQSRLEDGLVRHDQIMSDAARAIMTEATRGK